LTLEVAAQVGAVHILHDDVVAVAALAVVEDLDDVGVLQGGGSACLTLEARDEFGVGAIDFAQHLDGDLAAHAQVGSAEDGGHAAAPDGLSHPVAVADPLIRFHMPPHRGTAYPLCAQPVHSFALGFVFPACSAEPVCRTYSGTPPRAVVQTTMTCLI